MTIIPPDLLQALAANGGGQVALVIGAGCSIEQPTAIPLAGDLAETGERTLVLDGLLQPHQCPNPRDLAELATLVFELTGEQAALVRCFPIEQMRLAKPNLGYKLLVALMAEGAITHVLSLNFDKAVQNAAAELGVQIAVVTEPGDGVPMRAALVQLHGNADSVPEAMILRTEVLNEGWIGQWHQLVAQQILATPAILFAGLGSAAPVLSTTIDMIQNALAGGKQLYQADAAPFDTNVFAQQLSIPADRYIHGTWGVVVSKLAERIAAAQVDALRANGAALLAENGVEAADRDKFVALTERLRNQALLVLGKFRAHAVLDRAALYRPHSLHTDELLAEPLLRLAQLSEHFGWTALPAPGGTWTLNADGRVIGHLVLASGGGVRRLSALEPSARAVCERINENAVIPADFVLVGAPAAEAPPLAHVDLIADEDPADIIGGPSEALIISANDPDYLDRIGRLLHAA
ncbi:hypothetical protein [Novosphingobium sp. PhB57]|uniref:hypothetical protein n=1 Tax=Novosphingobium sp. PhB57 TaxID=2485107 RepID=UPI0010483A1D|nr:hypothetical protein [Novosphingobium sp. PhB57]